MSDPLGEHERPRNRDDFRERLGRMSVLVSQKSGGRSFRFGVAESLAVMVPLCVVLSVIRQLTSAEPPQTFLTFVIGVGICFITACVMVRRDRAKLRIALLVALEFAVIAGGFLAFIAYTGGFQ